MGGAASLLADSAPSSSYKYGEMETPTFIPTQAPSKRDLLHLAMQTDATSAPAWLGTSLTLPPKPFNLENYFLKLELVGTGMLGQVRLVQHRRSGLYYALKSVKKTEVLKHKMLPQLEAERDALECMTALEHPFSAKFFGTVQTTTHVHLLLEFVPGGELFRRLRAVGRLHNDEAKFYATELLVFLETCHENGIMYRDLKPENVLLDTAGHIKVVDFGFAKLLRGPDERASSSVGTPQYLAPEQLTVSNRTRSYSRAVDWWAFACVLYELVNGSPPFTARTTETHFEVYTRIMRGKIRWPSRMQPALKDLLRRMLVADPAKRIADPQSIKQHAWFQGVDWGAVRDRKLRAPFVPKLHSAGDTSNFNDYPSSTEETSRPLIRDDSRHDFSSF